MCGIVVGLAFGKLNQRDEAMRQRLLRYFTTELLVATESRGRDATGAAVLFNDGKYAGIKKGQTVSDFLSVFGESKKSYGGLLKIWRAHQSPGRIYLGHCRAGTTGDKEDNENNHPIKIRNLVGIHNGVIRNHDVIFKQLGCKRDGKVDSEAIFRLFDHFTNGGKEPFTMDMLQSIVDKLDGHFAVTLFNADNIEQVPIFRDGRPVEFVLIKPYGILLMLSELKFWRVIHFRYERLVYYYKELHSVNLPSFVDSDTIETKTMPDDSAAIFDLSKKVGKDTDIDDLCETGKMTRTNKEWKNKTTGYQSSNYYNSGLRSKSSDKDNAGKKRVFDKIKKQYVVKAGDKQPDTKKATTLPVDDNKDATKTDTTVNKKEEKKDNVVNMPTGNESVKESTKFNKDDEKEDNSADKVEVKDLTVYDSDKNEAENKKVADDVIDVDPKDVKVINDQEDKEDQKIKSEADVVEVDMAVNSPELVEAANLAYESLPTSLKGCGDIDELLDAIDLTKERAQDLGMALIGNRAIKHGWIQGYTHAMKSMPDKTVQKNRKREAHIAGLKSLVMLLARFYKRDNIVDTAAKNRLAQTALDNNRRINIYKLMKIFNTHERDVLKEVSEVVSQAEGVTDND